MRVSPSPYARVILLVALLTFGSRTFSLSLEELRSTPDLTPRKFASYFRDFEFKFRREVQTPEVFLATRSGDCDDYSTLAASILRARGYTPRLVTVRMPGVTHVVCYIEESGAYLDYNNRAFMDRTVSCRPDIDSIAESVARSYDLNWVSASEFTFEDGVKRLVATVMPSKKSARSFASLFR